MSLFEKIGAVLSRPKEFFAAAKAEKGIGPAFSYLAILGAVFAVLGILMSILALPVMMGMMR